MQDYGSDSDPVSGKVFMRITKTGGAGLDIVSIDKSNGTVSSLGLNDHSIVGYDTVLNKLLVYKYDNGNELYSVDPSNGTATLLLDNFASSVTSWNSAAISALDSKNRKYYRLDLSNNKIYVMNLSDSSESVLSLSSQVAAIRHDHLNGVMYGLKSGSGGGYELVSIDKTTGTLTTIGSGNVVSGISNYSVQIAPNDQRMYVQESGTVFRAISLSDGSSLGTFAVNDMMMFPMSVIVLGDDNTNVTVSTNFADPSANMIKLGSNKVTYTGTNSSSGITTVQEGQLFINGTASSSTVNIDSGATLGGAGTIGGITNSGNLEPGNSIGTLNVSGTVTLNSGSVLVIEVDTAGNTDKIVATGAVTAGGTLRISPGSGTYSSGQQYTIITGSSISGTFSTITVLSCTGTASASYGSTSITITLSDCVFNAPKNRETISSYVNDLSSGASGDLSTVITALNTLSGDNYNNALDALDYNSSGAISSVAQSQVASINNVIGQRVAASTIGNNKVVSLVGFIKSSSTIDQSNTLSFKDKLKQMGMTGWWTQVHGGTGDKKSLKDIGVNGYDFNHFGTTIGFDQQTDKGTEGYALTFQQGNIDSDNSEGSTDHKTFAVSKYQSTSIDNGKRRTLSGSFGITNVDSSRTLNFASINRKATASYNSYSLNGSAEYTYPEKKWFGSAHNLTVNGGLTLNYQEGFTETGANSLNLKVDSNHTQIANAGLVDTINWSDKTEGETIPFLSLGLHTYYHLGTVESKQRFVNQTNFTTKSDRRSNTHGEIGLGFIQSKDNNTELSFLAKSKFSDKLSENTATFKYSVKF